MDEGLRVEVFPVEPDRWIAVIGGPDGEFSTETSSPDDVGREVAASVEGVLGSGVGFHLVDDLGRPWSWADASAQLTRLGVVHRPERSTWIRRLFNRGTPYNGDCEACRHDWREHIPSLGECSECLYEIEHGEPRAPSTACCRMPSRRTRTA